MKRGLAHLSRLAARKLAACFCLGYWKPLLDVKLGLCPYSHCIGKDISRAALECENRAQGRFHARWTTRC